MATILSDSELLEQFNVTASQLDRTTRLIDTSTGAIYYKVASQTSEGVEYEVRAPYPHKLTCTCPAGNPPRDKFGMPLGPILPCWHKRAARAAAYEYRQQENLAARREAEQAEAARQAEERRAKAPLNGNRGFSMMKTAPVSMRGYDIRIERIGGPGWMNEKAHGYAPAGQLPAEWEQICSDPTVIQACIFPSNQRNWQANKRRHLAEYRQSQAVTA